MHTSELARIFASTDGVFTPAMAAQLGYSARTVRRWVERGVAVRLAGRALVPAGTTVTVRHRVLAAHLTWPDAIVCYVTAAVLHGLPIDDDGETHVLVPDTRHALRGFTVHRWSVRPTAVVRIGGVPVTDWHTTLADSLGRLPGDDAWGLLAWMWTHDQVSERDLALQIDDRYHLYGIVRLRLMLEAVRQRALSVGEMRLHDFLNEHGFVGWSADFRIVDQGRVIARADVAFPGQRLVIEFDGAVAHNNRTRARDRARDDRIEACGYDVVHVTWATLHERRHLLARALRAMLVLPPKSLGRAALADAVARGGDIRRLLGELGMARPAA